MIAEDFPQTGWQFVPGPRPPRRFQVFGERSSGTNFIKRLIARNTTLTPTEALGWKHGFAQMTAIPADTAIVACLRDARSWSLSMHAKPWHTPPEMQALGYSEFIRAPWTTVADRKRYFPQVQQIGGEGRPLQLDRHPLTGLPFESLFALRRAKLTGLLSFFHRDCTLILCRMEAVQAAPQAFLSALQAACDLPDLARPYQPITRRLGSRFLASLPRRPETPETVPESDMVFLRASLDLGQEARLGYCYP